LFYNKIFISIILIIFLFTVTGMMTTTKPSSRLSSSFFSTWTSNVDQTIFSFMFSIENTSYDLMNDISLNSPPLTEVLLNVMTSIKMNDLKSFIGHEIPGFSTYENRVIIAGEGLNDINWLSHESGPPLESILQDRKAIGDSNDELEEKTPEKGLTTDGRKVVFLYNSHNRESFLPHLPDEEDSRFAYHDEVNVTKISDRIAKSLEAKGIGASVDDTDIIGILHEKGWKFGKAYAASRPVVQEAISQNKDLQYIIDIHRDSLPREKTTKEIKGNEYATFLFVVGAEYKGYEKNLQLASKLHYLIEKKYPGLSRGVITKEGPNNNGVYNQDLLDNSLLVEIGGYENTLEEMYRSADVLAEVFSEIYWEAEQVNR